MSENKKYFYLKVKDTFFDLEEMKILESQKNGIEYQNLYLKLCLLSLKSGGALLFKDAIPYDINMLSTVLRVDIDTVKTGLEFLKRLGLIEILDTGVIFMLDIQSLIGSTSTEGERKKIYRDKIKEIACGTMSQKCPGHRTPEIEIELETDIYDKDKDKDIDKDKDVPVSDDEKPTPTVKRKHFVKPSLQEVSEFCTERKNTVSPEKFLDYYESNGWRVGRNPMKDWRAAVRNWEKNEIAGGKNGTRRGVQQHKSDPWEDPNYYAAGNMR